MTRTVTLPLWLVVILGAFASWALLDRLLIPSIRWYFRRRINRVIDHFNRRLAIRLQPFKLTKRQVLLDRLIFDPQVLEAVDAFAREEGMPREVVMGKVRRYAEEIVPAFNAYVYFRLGYWLARWAARLMYRVRLGSIDEEALERVPEDATVVFVMNHRSNMDYVLVSYMVAARSALSYAVGEWARIWPLETLIRAMGAYFVRRRSRNALYRRVLQRYVQMASTNGVTQAIYPEGGLSRDGRLQPARLGLLGYMLREFDRRGERDIVFVPVGLNYDRVLEDRTLLLDAAPPPDAGDVAPLNQERTGQEGPARKTGPIRKTKLAAAWTTLRFFGGQVWRMLTRRWYRYGYACVNFGRPVSMRAWLAEHQLDGYADLDQERYFKEIEALGEQLMHSVGKVIPVLPVALVAQVLMEANCSGVSELELKARVQERIEALEAAGAHVYVPRQDGDYAITVGLRMLLLRSLAKERDDGLFAAVPDQLPVLQYYANSIAHLRPAA